MKIKCSFCKKNNEFDLSCIKESGKAKVITCEHCRRRIIVEFNNEKYYKV